MNKTLAVIAAFSLIQLSSFAGSLTGSVHFTKPAPKAAEIKMAADPVCAKENAGKKVMDESVVVNGNKTLANVFVYVKEGMKKEGIPAAPTTPVKFDQNGCRYTPHVVGVRVGQPFQIINSDAVLHNVHSMAKTNAPFNMGMATKGQTLDKKFTKPETMVKIKCDVHGWMNAYVGVLDHPYFAVTDAQGSFNIEGLPAGEYTIEAWHEKLGTKTEKVKVADAVGKVDFSF